MDMTAITDESSPPFIVAELSGNHGGCLSKALQLVDKASEAGADAIKLQTYKPDTITVDAQDSRFLLQDGLWKGKYLYDLYKQAMTPWEWHREIAVRAKEKNMVCFSSPFDETAVEFLERELNPPLYKIASFELNHFPLLRKVGALRKPVLASIGVSDEEEIGQAVQALKDNGCPEVILLYCVSEYPAKVEDFELSNLPKIQQKFGCKVGLSDHSDGCLMAVAATALGACVIEKHLTLDRDSSSIDGAFSLLPEEFTDLCSAVRKAHKGIKSKTSNLMESSRITKRVKYKRSILVCKDIKKGELLDPTNLRIARPGDGMCPSKWEVVLNKKASRDMKVGHPLCREDVS